MSKKIHVFSPYFRIEEVLNEIKGCLEIGWTGLGFKTLEIEKEWSKYTGLDHSHFLSSATAGLHLAIKVLKDEYGWKNGDEVITTPITFISTNHAILYERLTPIFADIDKYGCMDPKSVVKKITNKTKAVVFVGLGGNTGQLEEIINICHKQDLKLILDAAHMAGTRSANVNLKDIDAIVYSFQAVKNMPTADSGMICFSDSELDNRARKLSWLGIDKDTYSRTNSNRSYKWKYDVIDVGFKYHGNSIMAAIALVQLKHLDKDNERRQEIAGLYSNILGNNMDIVQVAPNCISSRHLFQVLVKNRDKILLSLNEKGIYPGVHYAPNTNYKMYEYAKGTCPHADDFGMRVLSLPMHLRLTDDDVNYVAECLLEATSSGN